MKNVQVIDGAVNCTYPIYAFTDDEFLLVFPASGQDIEFIDDAIARFKSKGLVNVLKNVWSRPIKKANAVGIHGTLYYELEEKKEFYPTKSEKDVEGPPHSSLQTTKS